MSPLYPPAAHGELLPVEHNLALIPTLISNGDPTVLCRVKRKGCAVCFEKRSRFGRFILFAPAAKRMDGPQLRALRARTRPGPEQNRASARAIGAITFECVDHKKTLGQSGKVSKIALPIAMLFAW